MTRLARAGVLAIVGGWAAVIPVASPAAAQEEPIGNVDISLDVGEIDPTSGDWTLVAVEVTGDLEEGQDFTVEIRGEGDRVLWTGTAPYDGPGTRIEVDGVLVGDVASAGVSQGLTVVAGVQIKPPDVDWKAGGGGGGGQLALSMVLAVLLVAIVFRTPLPSATTQRWTK